MSRNQVQFVANATLVVSEVPVSDMSVREIVNFINYYILYFTIPEASCAYLLQHDKDI
jgi:hypothetical protein